MTSAVRMDTSSDQTDAPSIVRGSLKLGLLEAVIVFLISLASRLLDGPIEAALEAILLLMGLTLVTALPGLWTRARTIEGIAGAATIGLGAAVVFMLVDIVVLQHVGTYTHRWLDIGGGSNWWYHPVWWMVGTFLPWMGAWILANQTGARGAPSVPGLMGLAVFLALVCGLVAVLIHFPGAGWNVPTFGIAFLPGLAFATVISSLGARRA